MPWWGWVLCAVGAVGLLLVGVIAFWGFAMARWGSWGEK
jgi:hypothetical protein